MTRLDDSYSGPTRVTMVIVKADCPTSHILCGHCNKKGYEYSKFFVLFGKTWCSLECCEKQIILEVDKMLTHPDDLHSLLTDLKEKAKAFRGNPEVSDAFNVGYQQGLAEAQELLTKRIKQK